MSKAKSWSCRALSLLDNLNNFFRPDSTRDACIPLFVNEEKVGILQPELVQRLHDYPHTFNFIKDPSTSSISAVKLSASLQTYDSRSEALRSVIVDLTEKNAFETLRYWRHEDYEIASGPSNPPLLKMERAATSLFGVRTYGSHMNGYIRHPEKGICLWLAKRSATKQTFPGMLDNLAAGGIGAGLGIRETMIKECWEEASIPEEIAKNVVSVGCISYIYENSRGVNAEVQYCYDLELPMFFKPVPLDGEVQEFMLCDIAEVKDLIVQDNFKPNCAAITLDFLIRHGFVTPDNEPKYTEIVNGLHNRF